MRSLSTEDTRFIERAAGSDGRDRTNASLFSLPVAPDWIEVALAHDCQEMAFRTVDEAVNECYSGYVALAAKRGRNPRWPYVPIIMRPRADMDDAGPLSLGPDVLPDLVHLSDVGARQRP
ncbi:hypothetical protein [Sphingopyxis sp.]|uniref:hypothetical protein n=1 Tax=Sphingopyxis sp. TaxID=1908224 RepID=UPI0010F6B0B3|nr:hypothetical protein [Sphingopyxis sp.]MBR2171082.1 hypothetical protein [Sphingopyxis sp.]